MSTGWIVGGDFNDILHLRKKIGGLPASLRRCTPFQHLINKCNLIELSSYGYSYTWGGPLTHVRMRIYGKLDRVF